MRLHFSPAHLASLLLTIAAGCAPTAPPTAAPAAQQTQTQTRFYVGTMTTTSPDGAQAYGPPQEIAARRTLDRRAETIDEYVVHPGRAYPTRLRRSGEDGTMVVFSAEDEARSFSGTVSFEGPEWAWTAWTYDLLLTDGTGTLHGSGSLSAHTIETDKLFVDADGRPQARIGERLEEVDQATFTRKRDALLAAPPQGRE